ncbi:2-iminoacetate synthase ThiH [Neobacillus niacini]|nr:2-iminoacetate synthase ThiH [Neobacillus niacini]
MVHILRGDIMTAIASEKEVDKEWVELIRKALDLGIPADEIRDFLNKSS